MNKLDGKFPEQPDRSLFGRIQTDVPKDWFLRDIFPEYRIKQATPAERQVECLAKLLEAKPKERDLLRFFKENPVFLSTHLGGGHGRWVLPEFQFGKELVADFVVGEKHSFGYEWQLVELESPSAKMFTKKGDPTKELTHAIRQLQDWRSWLQVNQNYAARAVDECGLGLTDIITSPPGLIVIGRRNDNDENTNSRRRQMMYELRIEIRSYDSFLDKGSGRVLSQKFP